MGEEARGHRGVGAAAVLEVSSSPGFVRVTIPAVSDVIVATKRRQIDRPLNGPALVKETCRRIRVARSYWDAHNNRACRGERTKALLLYEALSDAEREKVPQELRVWLRYRSEKYFGAERTPPRRRGR